MSGNSVKKGNGDKYKAIFLNEILIPENKLEVANRREIEAWDSVGHLSLITAMEDAFGFIMSNDEVMKFDSYKKGVEILKVHGIEI